MLEENVEAVRLFLASSTQWRLAGMGGVPLGLDYPCVEAAARMMNPPVNPIPFEDLRVMELTALKVLIDRHSRK